MIEFVNVTKKYKNRIALDSISLSIPKGTFFGLVGPNGAGKTTLLRILMTLLSASSGNVYVCNSSVHRNNSHVKKMIGYVPQRINLDKSLSVLETMKFSSALYDIPYKKSRSRIEELLELIHLKEHINALTTELSGGMKRKLMVIQALIHQPDILILDEPSVGIDACDRRALWDVLRGYHQQGKTVCFTTHYIEEAQALSQQVCLIDRGKILENDKPETLIGKIGTTTVEYFQDATEYRHFNSRKNAEVFANSLTSNYTLRDTTLEDVFYAFTKRRIVK